MAFGVTDESHIGAAGQCTDAP